MSAATGPGATVYPRGDMSRRRLLAALGATIVATGVRAAAVTASGASDEHSSYLRNTIDVHSHYLSPAYVRELDPEGYVSDNMRRWSLSALLEGMEQASVARSVLSVTTPAVPFGGQRAMRIARELNEYGARLVAEHRPKLGLFATLPMYNSPDQALAEASYALDALKASGIGLLTNYDNKWLGDASFDPLFEELNHRGVTVFVHPTVAACCNPKLPFIRTSVIEYGTDTTRAITNYVYGGAGRRFDRVNVIFSHAGGTMPYLIERFDVTDRTTRAVRVGAPEGFRAQIKKFFYDTAQSSNPVTMGALRQVVPLTQIVFGTDYPYRTQQEHVRALEQGNVFSRAELAQIYRANVASALPALVA